MANNHKEALALALLLSVCRPHTQRIELPQTDLPPEVAKWARSSLQSYTNITNGI